MFRVDRADKDKIREYVQGIFAGIYASKKDPDEVLGESYWIHYDFDMSIEVWINDDDQEWYMTLYRVIDGEVDHNAWIQDRVWEE